MSRSNSFFKEDPMAKESVRALEADIDGLNESSPSDKESGVVVVDPFSTGAQLAAGVCAKGYKCVRILSIWDSPVASLIQSGVNADFHATLQFDDRLDDEDKATNDVCDQIRALPFPVVAVLAGAETGVELADRLSHRLGLRSNGEEGSLARRNKFHMGEAVRSAGVRAVKQRFCRSASEVKVFLIDLKAHLDKYQISFKCVVKPVQSAGTDDVFLCDSIDEAVTAFTRIFGKKNGLGLLNDGALVQEFLKGKEYVIDKVSRDGKHKLVAVWQYDKRPIHGSAFVYFGMKLCDPTQGFVREMISYADEVLNALGINQGPSHMEVIYCADGPCLVEVGSRCHGGEGTWLEVAQECVGYTQVSVTLDCYLENKLWSIIPTDTFVKRKAGRDIDLVNRHSGIIRGFPGENALKAMPTYRSHHWETQIGEFAPLTIDCFTRPGCVQLVAETEEEADEALEYVHSLEEMHMLDYTIQCKEPPTMGTVCIVDPFSTGANLAADVVRMGYRLVLVFSEVDSPVSGFVGTDAKSTAKQVIYHDARPPRSAETALADTIKAVEKATSEANSPLLAVLAGAETGVELADVLSERMHCRSNKTEKSAARRSKDLMQETVRKAGLRSIKQKYCMSTADLVVFWESLGGSRCVLKPNSSAGSDSVYLCESLVQAQTAFNNIAGKVNGLGAMNIGALAQEFLEGTEYVVDGVSRDGVYKVVSIWEYDKRSVNGANFVYYGMRLRSGAGERAQKMIEYAEKVNRAVGIDQGPSHMEIMFTADGPCLVEVGSRCHGGEGTWLGVAQECVGYTQVSATLDCYLRPDQYDLIPKYPVSLFKEGGEAFLVSTYEGQLKAIPGLKRIRALDSFRKLETLVQPGMMIVPTIDCFTRPGSVQMVANTPAGFDRDYNTIRELEKRIGPDGLFTLLQTKVVE